MEKEKPIKPKLPEDAPQDIVAAVPGVLYIDVTSDDAKKEAIDDAVNVFGGALQAEDFIVDDGTALLRASNGVITKAAEDALAKNSERATVAEMHTLPIFGVESSDIKEAGAVVAVGFEMKGSEFLAAKPEDVRLLKVQGSAAGKFFKYAASDSAFGDGCFTVQDENDKIFPGAFEAETKYKLVLFINDNGEFDLRKTEREILDPAAIVKTEARPSGGSSSGCSAGLGIFALLALLPLAAARRRR
ncbi:MAG: SYNERG-CTERM sorting domain-containing protein [Synergistaceae bacterium]|nr:SYNERG-CTERM sorting domain-containing protein [Synergistaceae bacterium]